jgi:hypothetical protein
MKERKCVLVAATVTIIRDLAWPLRSRFRVDPVTTVNAYLTFKHLAVLD